MFVFRHVIVVFVVFLVVANGAEASKKVKRQLFGGGGRRGGLLGGTGSKSEDQNGDGRVDCDSLSPEDRKQNPQCGGENKGESVSGVLTRPMGSLVNTSKLLPGANTASGIIPQGVPGAELFNFPFGVEETAKKFNIPPDELEDPETISVTFPPDVTERILTRVADGLVSSGTSFPFPLSLKNIYVPTANPFERFQSCQSNYFGSGHCRYFHHCMIPDLMFNIPRLVQHLCFVSPLIVGLCCPDASYRPRPTRPSPTQPPKPSGGVVTPAPAVVTSAPAATPKPAVSDDIRASCGLNFETRIVGGKEADPKDWLWMAAILRNGNEQFCGGALISKNHVLSAAHCFVRYNTNIKVRLGEYDFAQSDETRTQDYDVSEIRSHANYDRQSHVNDIAVLKLARPASFTTYVRPLCMPVPGNSYFAEDGTVVGWGTLSYGGPSSKVLREIQLPVWNNTDCNSAFNLPIIDEFLCAGVRDGSRDACQGDSGGPLMLEGPRRRWMIIGVVSWGIRCAEVGYPGVYTRVTEYLQWIDEHTKD